MIELTLVELKTLADLLEPIKDEPDIKTIYYKTIQALTDIVSRTTLEKHNIADFKKEN